MKIPDRPCPSERQNLLRFGSEIQSGCRDVHLKAEHRIFENFMTAKDRTFTTLRRPCDRVRQRKNRPPDELSCPLLATKRTFHRIHFLWTDTGFRIAQLVVIFHPLVWRSSRTFDRVNFSSDRIMALPSRLSTLSRRYWGLSYRRLRRTFWSLTDSNHLPRPSGRSTNYPQAPQTTGDLGSSSGGRSVF
jgi:hypothetical protein